MGCGCKVGGGGKGPSKLPTKKINPSENATFNKGKKSVPLICKGSGCNNPDDLQKH